MAAPPTFFDERKIVACYSILNEAETIRQSLISVYPHVDKILIMDGAYEGWPSPEDNSTDETLQRIQEVEEFFGLGKIKLQQYSRMTQGEKRNKLFTANRPGDILLVLDGDEILFGNCLSLYRDQFTSMKCSTIGYVRVLHWRGAWDWRPRIFVACSDLKYDHWFRILHGDQVICDLKANPAPAPSPDSLFFNGFGVVNLHLGYRSKERDEAGNVCKEQMLREKWR
ncbi:MAG: glycosyltransferase family 2 protein [Thaumarchaeota archaeon]|nr:glycosyltransferase family 2 protein [Nitrososphaerota archaeon]MCL5318609.1 glycosyltransferase family 2 protein [Nitrososphaerota archaeon]